MQLNTPVKLTSITSCHCSLVIFFKEESLVIPALLTKMSILPYASIASLVAFSTSENIAVFTLLNSALPPLAIISFLVDSPFSSFISQMITTAPSSANFRAPALPIPSAPPVIMAILFSSLFMI